jgi:hypothetical protein
MGFPAASMPFSGPKVRFPYACMVLSGQKMAIRFTG